MNGDGKSDFVTGCADGSILVNGVPTFSATGILRGLQRQTLIAMASAMWLPWKMMAVRKFFTQGRSVQACRHRISFLDRPVVGKGAAVGPIQTTVHVGQPVHEIYAVHRVELELYRHGLRRGRSCRIY